MRLFNEPNDIVFVSSHLSPRINVEISIFLSFPDLNSARNVCENSSYIARIRIIDYFSNISDDWRNFKKDREEMKLH